MFNLEVTVKHRHFLCCAFSDSKYKTFYLFFVYAHENVKNVFWQEFTSYIKSLDLPYVIMGDLNEIKNASEKTGGQMPTMNRFFRLNNFINDTGLLSLPFYGSKFTWRKSKDGPNNIHEILDRALVNADWHKTYDKAIVHHLPFTTSDHCPIVLELNLDYRSVWCFSSFKYGTWNQCNRKV